MKGVKRVESALFLQPKSKTFMSNGLLCRDGQMKCVLCNEVAAEKIIEYKESGVSLGKFPGRVCPKCGESYFESDIAGRIQAKPKKLGLFGLAAKAKVAELGNSYAIRVPKRIARLGPADFFISRTS